MGHFTNYKIDHRSRKSMINFIDNHAVHSERYQTTIAHNVKVRMLDLPRELDDLVYEYLELENGAVWWFYGRLISDQFANENPGYYVCQAGRSGGWLELWAGSKSACPERSLWEALLYTTDEIRQMCYIIEKFDKFCDYMRDELITSVRDYAIEKTEQVEIESDEKAARMEPAFPL